MNKSGFPILRFLSLAVFIFSLGACGGGGGGSGGSVTAADSPTQPPPSVPAPDPGADPIIVTTSEAARFLSQATFGPDSASIETVVASSLEAWLLDELAKPPTLHLQDVLDRFPDDGTFLDEQGMPLPELVTAASDSFWQKSITADDQLRQRMAFALSQILVVSTQSDLARVPQTVAAYMDVLTTGAFGNFRDLLENVTYSPAMAVYLTYLRNEKADPATGRVPDENYARELMQLFTIGLVELNQDGTPVLDSNGDPIELFDNTDITGLASVFTGLSFGGTGFTTPLRFLPFEAYYLPLQMFDEYHSSEAKTFLGTTIAPGTDGEQSIDLALDVIFAHPNVGPFIARQLIQRFVTSHPSPEYVSRVAGAFDVGTYSLPSATQVGAGERGDLAATLAAVLFDGDARIDAATTNEAFGKLREPVIRFTHWARAFEINSADASNEPALRDTSSSELLAQHPYRSPSVFNFYRPGYIAPGTETGAAQLTAPGFQISNATTIMGYPNFLTVYTLGLSPKFDPTLPPAFVADYAIEAELATDTEALLDHLDLLLTHGTLLDETRQRISAALDEIADVADPDLRARLASVMVMTAPEYIVLR